MDSAAAWTALSGGALIGASASLLLTVNGRVAGISGILAGVLPPRAPDTAWRAWFLAGLLLGGVLLRWWLPDAFGVTRLAWPLIVLAGLAVGFGTRLGGGCTSGHGVCGISRLSLRSVAATLTFMLTGVLATYLLRHVFTTSGVGP